MAQPPKYLKLANFAQLGAVPPVALDTELVNIANSVNASATNLGLIQRDDGALKDGLVTIAALSASALVSLAGAANQAVVDSATASATSATASATSATASATSATASATSATASATSATASATSATASATSATASATSATASATSATASVNAIATRDAALTAETNARIAADTAEIARANAVYLPLAGNAAQAVSVAPATLAAHAARFDQLRTYQSPLVTPLPGAGVLMSYAHGLGVAPKKYDIEVVCLVAELGCAIGDVLRPFTSMALYNTPYSAGANASVIFAKNSAISPAIVSLSTGLSTVLTPANWAYRFIYSKE